MRSVGMKPLALVLTHLAVINGQRQGPGGNAPAPGGTTTGACAADGSDYSYVETVSGQTRTVVTNHCPNHQWTQINPNYPISGSTTYNMPAYPQYEPTVEVSLASQGGSVGVLYNGAQLYSAYGGQQYGTATQYSNSAPFAEGDTFDECGCHGSSTTAASYHCHVPPHCLLNQLQDNGSGHSPQVGWAVDGFPVYGPYTTGGILMQTCTAKGTSSSPASPCADDCGGYYGSITPDDGYTYRYYMMGETTFGTSCTTPDVFGQSSEAFWPHTPICYKGCCPTGATCSNLISACSGNAQSGLTGTANVQFPSGLSANTCPGGTCDATGTTTDATCLANVAAITTPTNAVTTPTNAVTTPTEAATTPTTTSPAPAPATTVADGDLAPPSQYVSVNGVLDSTLIFDTVPVDLGTGNAVYVTRGWNKALPGPTFRFAPGDTVNILLQNVLGENVEIEEHNVFKDVNTTNIHTHGLHVSSDPGQDDIFTVVGPGQSFQYSFDIPSFHMPGTHWYHPHHHGSTSLHAGGGAAGLMIVEDTPDLGLPSAVTEAEEIEFILSHMDMNGLSTIAEAALGNVLDDIADVGTNMFVLVNGQYMPNIPMEPNKWYRWRMVYASIEVKLEEITLEGCEFQLIAKDGIYLETAPRAVSSLFFAPGNRADVMVRCQAAGTFNLDVATAAGKRRSLLGGNAGPGGGGAFTGIFATVTVAGPTGTAAAIPSFSVARPCYIVDLTNAAATGTFDVALRAGGSFTVNNALFSDANTYINEYQIGGVEQWEITGVSTHPFHMHINPYQISSLDATDEWFQIGDWHDTFYTPLSNRATIKFQTDTFAGKVVLHCHILEHEDRGMMAVTWINQAANGAPTTWSGAFGVDSTCKHAGNPYERSASTPATPTSTPATPTPQPVLPTAAPTGTPTAAPTATPTATPTGTPTATPTGTPTGAPTAAAADITNIECTNRGDTKITVKSGETVLVKTSSRTRSNTRIGGDSACASTRGDLRTDNNGGLESSTTGEVTISMNRRCSVLYYQVIYVDQGCALSPVYDANMNEVTSLNSVDTDGDDWDDDDNVGVEAVDESSVSGSKAMSIAGWVVLSLVAIIFY